MAGKTWSGYHKLEDSGYEIQGSRRAHYFACVPFTGPHKDFTQIHDEGNTKAKGGILVELCFLETDPTHYNDPNLTSLEHPAPPNIPLFLEPILKQYWHVFNMQ